MIHQSLWHSGDSAWGDVRISVCDPPEGQIKPHCLPFTQADLIPLRATHRTTDAALKSVENQVTLNAPEHENNTRLSIAHDLGMHRSTSFGRREKLGIDIPGVDGAARSGKDERVANLQPTPLLE